MSELNAFQRWWLNALPHRLHVRKHIPQFLKKCPEPFRGEVLEIGAGRGWTSRQILETFPQVELTTTDIEPTAEHDFEALRERYGRRLKVKKANVLDLSFDRDSFDIVLAINVMQHLQPYGVRKAIEELLRVVRPGGMIGISDYFLLSAPFRSRKPVVMEVLQKEDCDIVYDKGDTYYDMWIQKSYPVDPSYDL